MQMARKILLFYGAILILAAFLFGCGKTGRELVSVAPWPMFHCDLQHTGTSPYVGPQTGVLEWKFRTNDRIGCSPAIAKDGTVYVGSEESYLYALKPDGTLKWKFETGDWVVSSPAIAKDGTVYVGSGDSYLYALKPDGSLKWKFETGDCVGSSPAIAKDGTVYVGSGDSYLYALKPDGSLKWKFETGDWVASSPAIAKDGTVYVGSEDSYLYALKPDGSLKWKFETGDWVVSSPAIAKDGTVYVGSQDGYIYAIDPDGTLKWKFTAGVVFSSPAIGENGTVYVGSNTWYYLYAIHADGTLKWKFETGDWVGSSPAIAKDGTVYVGSEDSYLYALKPDGSLKWKFETGGEVFSSPAIGQNGTLYVGSNDYYLYAIGTKGAVAEMPTEETHSGPQSHILGKWKDTKPLIEGSDSFTTLEFFRDGTLLATHFYWGSTSSTGEYKFVDDRHIKLDFGVVLGSYVCTFSLFQDELILEFPDTRGIRTYRKVAEASVPIGTYANAQSQILGKWKDTKPLIEGSDSFTTLEFFRDGTLLATYFYWGSTSSTGEYKFVDDRHIKLDFGVVLGSYVCTFSLFQDELILEFPDERGVRTYQRVAGGDS
jgi:outer membrane protein assembly factor BamB